MVFTFILLLSFAAMEGVAWFSHRFIMHGFGWGWHASHHQPRKRAFERNDLYGLVFSIIAMALMLLGVRGSGNWIYASAIGLGMTLYGGAYLFLHDMLVHKRFGVNLHPRSGYLRAVIRSHRLHHAHRGKDGCHSFGFLIPMPPATAKRLARDRLQGAEQ